MDPISGAGGSAAEGLDTQRTVGIASRGGELEPDVAFESESEPEAESEYESGPEAEYDSEPGGRTGFDTTLSCCSALDRTGVP